MAPLSLHEVLRRILNTPLSLLAELTPGVSKFCRSMCNSARSLAFSRSSLRTLSPSLPPLEDAASPDSTAGAGGGVCPFSRSLASTSVWIALSMSSPSAAMP